MHLVGIIVSASSAAILRACSWDSRKTSRALPRLGFSAIQNLGEGLGMHGGVAARWHVRHNHPP